MKSNIKIESVKFNVSPVLISRLPGASGDKNIIITSKDGKKRTLLEDKILYPFLLQNSVIVTVFLNNTKFSFKINKGYVFNGADIPPPLEFFVGSREDIRFLLGALVHDFMLEYRDFIFNCVLHQKLSVNQYIKLTTLIFREIIKSSGTNTILANCMSWFVQVYQSTINRKAWNDITKIATIKTSL